MATPKHVPEPEWDWDELRKVKLPWCSMNCWYRATACGKCTKLGYEMHDMAGVCWPVVHALRPKKEVKI